MELIWWAVAGALGFSLLVIIFRSAVLLKHEEPLETLATVDSIWREKTGVYRVEVIRHDTGEIVTVKSWTLPKPNSFITIRRNSKGRWERT